MNKSVFSLTKGEDKIEVVKAERGSFEVLYFFGDDSPMVVGTSSLEHAMELARSFAEDTATEQ